MAYTILQEARKTEPLAVKGVTLTFAEVLAHFLSATEGATPAETAIAAATAEATTTEDEAALQAECIAKCAQLFGQKHRSSLATMERSLASPSQAPCSARRHSRWPRARPGRPGPVSRATSGPPTHTAAHGDRSVLNSCTTQG